MELNVFMRELESALVQRGIPNETALRHVANLKRTFTSDDLSEIEAIQSNDQINELADSISVILNRNRTPQIQPQAPAPQTGGALQDYPADPASSYEGEIRQTAPEPIRDERPLPEQIPPDRPRPAQRQPAPRYDTYQQEDPYDEPDYEPEQRPQKQKAPAQKPRKQDRRGSVDDYFEYAPDAAPSTKGMILFWVGLFITLPITLGIAAAVFGVFAVLFVAMAALIVASVAVVIALVAGGAVTSLVAVVFGITQLFHIGGGTVIAGIYEIGLGVMVAGLVLFLAVLLYNFAIRFLPWVISKLGSFLGYLCGKAKDLFLYVRRECYQL